MEYSDRCKRSSRKRRAAWDHTTRYAKSLCQGSPHTRPCESRCRGDCIRRTTLRRRGRINGKIFINNSSIGIYPYLVLERRRRRRRLSNGRQLFWLCRACFGTCLCSGSRFAFKVWLSHAAARACSLGTTSIVSQCRPSAGVMDSIGGSCVSMLPRCKVGHRCFRLPAAAFSAFSISNATCASSRAIRLISARAAAGCSLRSTVRLKPCGRRCTAGTGRGRCASSLRLVREFWLHSGPRL
jgi:hypothetical protein